MTEGLGKRIDEEAMFHLSEYAAEVARLPLSLQCWAGLCLVATISYLAQWSNSLHFSGVPGTSAYNTTCILHLEHVPSTILL